MVPENLDLLWFLHRRQVALCSDKQLVTILEFREFTESPTMLTMDQLTHQPLTNGYKSTGPTE